MHLKYPHKVTQNLHIGSVPRYTVKMLFSRKSESLDWGQIRSADLRLCDLTQLQPLLSHLMSATLDRSDLTLLEDTRLIKAFRLTQFAFEALHGEQNQLCDDIKRASNTQLQLHSQLDYLQQEIKDQAQSITQLEEVKTQKSKKIEAKHQACRQGVNARSVREVMQRANAVTCPHCEKRFLSSFYLNEHVKRKHGTGEKREITLEMKLEEFREYFAKQLKETTERSTKNIDMIRTNYEPIIIKAPPEPSPVAEVDPTASIQEFLEAQQRLRSQLASLSEFQPPPASEPTPSDSEDWLTRLELSLQDLVTSSVEKWKAAHPPPSLPEPEVTIQSPEVTIQPPEIQENAQSFDLPIRFYPESMVLTYAGDIEDDDPSPRPDPQPHSHAGFIELDECDEPEETVNQLEEIPDIVTHARTGQMSTLMTISEPRVRHLTLEEVELAAEDLGMDLNFERQNAFLVRAMLLCDLPEWEVEFRGKSTVYRHTVTGHLSTTHPALDLFHTRLTQLRSKKWKHEYRDFLLCNEPHILVTSNQPLPSLFEHTSDQFNLTRTQLISMISKRPNQPRRKNRPRITGPSVVIQGFMEKLSLDQLRDDYEKVDISEKMMEGEVLAQGSIAPNDLTVSTTIDRETRAKEVSSQTIRRLIERIRPM